MNKKIAIIPLFFVSNVFASEFTSITIPNQYSNNTDAFFNSSGQIKDNHNFMIKDKSIFIKDSDTSNRNITFTINNESGIINQYNAPNLLMELKNHIGQKVSFYDVDNSVSTGVIFNVINNNLFVKYTGKKLNNIVMVDLNKLILPKTFFEKLNSDIKVNFNKEIKPTDNYNYSFFNRNLNWFPHYDITIKDQKSKTLDLNFFATIKNNSNKNFNNINKIILMNYTQQNQFDSPELYRSNKMLMSANIQSDANYNMDFKNLNSQSYIKFDNIYLDRYSSKVIPVKSFTSIPYKEINKIDINSLLFGGNNIQSYISIDTTRTNLNDTLLPTGNVYIYSNVEKIKTLYSKSKIENTNHENLLIQIPNNPNLFASILNESEPNNRHNKYKLTLTNKNDQPAIFYMTLYNDDNIKLFHDQKLIKPEVNTNTNATYIEITVPKNSELNYSIFKDKIKK